MGQEIEKKYLLREDGVDYATPYLLALYPSVDLLRQEVLDKGVPIKQGYLADFRELADLVGFNGNFEPTEARLRVKFWEGFYFTLKGDGSVSRGEFEVGIDSDLFDRYWDKTARRRVEKVRLADEIGGVYTVEFDVYTDRDLIVAEIEVPSLEMLAGLPVLGKDVTEDKKYKNKNLAR